MNASGGTPATAPALKSSGWARVVGRARRRRRSGCRRSASRRARRRSARSAAHSRSKRTWSSSASAPANASQSSIQSAARSRKSSSLGRADRRARLAQQPRRGRERRRRLVRRAVLVGRPERQHLPPRLARAAASQSTHAYASGPSRPDGQRGGVQLHPGGTREVHVSDHVGYSTPRCPHRSAANLRAGSGSQSRRRPRRRAYAVKRTVGDTVAVSADIFRDGHEKLRAVVKYKAPGGRRWLETELHAVDAHINGVRWAGEFTVETPGRWEFTIEAWTDRWATWHDELRARSRPTSTRTSRGEISEGVVLLERALAASRAATARARSQHALERARRRRRADAEKFDVALGAGALRGDGGGPRARGRDARSRSRSRSRSTASRPASAPGTSCSRAPGAA